MPVGRAIPPVVARPKACVSWSKSPHVQPPSARAVRPTGSTRTLFMRDRSIIRPPSQTAKPGTPWPPPRTATTRLWLRANVTAVDDVGNAGAADDQRRTPVDHAIMNGAGAVVVGITGTEQVAAQAALELLDGGCRESGLAPSVVVVG